MQRINGRIWAIECANSACRSNAIGNYAFFVLVIEAALEFELTFVNALEHWSRPVDQFTIHQIQHGLCKH